MKLHSIYIVFLLTTFFLIISENSNAQLDRSKIIASYIYNFGNNVQWKTNNFDEFNIILLSSNQEIIQELNKMSLKQKIKNKPIKLIVLQNPNNQINNAQLVLITNDKLADYMTVFDMVEGKEILLVSENFTGKSYVMLNLFDTKNNKIQFEINKPNIINQNLNISDEMLLMGGSEIDIAEIYLKSQHSLRKMEIETKWYRNQLDSLKKNINNRNLQVNKLNKIIERQNKQIDSQKVTQTIFNNKISDFKIIIDNQLNELKNYKIKLLEMTSNFEKNEKILKTQNKKIAESKIILKNQQLKIENINNEINLRNKILTDKEEIINRQQNRMFLLFIIIFLTLLTILVIFYAYRQNKKKSERIQEQQSKIKQINIELNKNNNELKNTLSELKLIQQKLIQSEKMASLGILSAGIAHELNNPINFVHAGINSLLKDFEDIKPIISGINNIDVKKDNLKEKIIYINELKKKYSFEEAYNSFPLIINDIKLGANRTTEIIKRLSDFTRIDKGELKQTNIHENIETALLLLKNKYKKRITIIKDFDTKINNVVCYPGKINQVFLNLISNAIDSISDKGKIWIKTKQEKEKIIISIKDNGSGINESIKDKIFDPFYTTKPVGQGTGLGLSISYGIIEEHNGKIELITEINKGSEFIISLPIKEIHS